MDEFQSLLSRSEAEVDGPAYDESKVPILVIHDEDSIRRGLSRVFSHQYDVLTAE